jgi:cardiolipin synthase
VQRRAPLAPLRLAAALAATAIGLTGCQLQLSSAASAPSSHHKTHHASASPAAASAAATGATPAATAPDLTLVTEPEAGYAPLYRLIKEAKHSIDMTMYEFADSTAEHDLAAAAGRGVLVRVILDRREKSLNTAACDYLRAHRVQVAWSSASFDYTHQKTVVTDDAEAVIMTANLTSKYYATSRDFLVTDTDRADIAAITRVFDADFSHAQVRPGNGHDLVWSPGSEPQLLALISGARKSLRIYSEEMGDSAVIDALTAAARRGVDVQVCGENSGGEYDSDFARLASAGVHISYYSSAAGFYIHGKVIEADYGTPEAKAFIGSENFSATSLDDNRELGIITSAPAILSSVASSFAGDFANGKHWR